MFEKDIYQLIRGLRARKGTEREYIQECIRECRKEIKSQDMDQKATALLKLVYLEMFGHDMSWASFNVLEVMSSAKYLQKRVGYLAAVQSFRPDTEVLMLAENLLKKDLNSPDKVTIGLPLATIPHVINTSMANSLLTDLLPRLSHSLPAIRKKTIVTLYRLALVYPETLRPAWPKIKERLLDENEDSSVTAAIVNVVCELGWRRPHDFLPLAPRLFELLTSGTNNWMAIKIIKLFSVLTPLEPRLVKKLLPPLTTIIKNTPAMSLLYECINGIIQGGIMEAAEGTTEGDEIARLCVNKLRAMLVVEGDPNLRYVALLAFVKITSSHADLVSQHQDVILECIDDADISIRTRALDLVAGMVNANNLQTVVERLLRQLRSAGKASAVDEQEHDRAAHDGIIPMADDEEDSQATIRAREQKSKQAPPLPDDYRTSVIERIVDMSSRETYTNLNDFEWYVGVLVELVKQCPSSSSTGKFGILSNPVEKDQLGIADLIGSELLNVAVRVKAVRPEAAAAAQSLLMIEQRETLFPSGSTGGQGVLRAAAFVAGEYANMLPDTEAVLTSLLHSSCAQLPATTLMSYLQAIPKVFTALTSSQEISWSSTRKGTINLLIARVVHFLEPLTLHPNLEVQERAVEYLDLMRLASEAASNQDVDTDGYAEPPLLLTQAIPALFSGMELNPVAATAIRKVPQPEDLDLDTPINSELHMILSQADYDTGFEDNNDDVYRFYHEKPSAVKSAFARPAADLLEPPTASRSTSYQSGDDESVDRESLLRKKAERRERYKDDPYYIDSERGSGASTPMHNILRNANGEDLDVDDIPVMELKLDPGETAQERHRPIPSHPVRKQKKHFEIAADETLGGDDVPASYSSSPSKASAKAKKSLLQLDSSGLSSLSLDDTSVNRLPGGSRLDVERRLAEEEEMTRAIKEVERLRLEMQRAQERIQPKDIPEEGTVVKRKKKKKERKVDILGDDAGGEGEDGTGVAKKKKKKKKPKEGDSAQKEAEPVDEDAAPVKAKRKKKRQVTFDDDHDEAGA
ncbi:related to APL5-AP-3 complex subunit, gamma-adaptin, 107 KD [Ramularia collo-cygni]|uniref:AP-3 complex subunit delta n=1 Tax=Ramularia collo-cygni TaxID=112498 RepID=A0A2D3V692_9PEZI|nr:related to APL5-AP-3 complex subunit, gamma-adaptin, 107 KD [Ramularia collo-cygni]CZT18044.1 related to APL5-AP-3 complex subunit, gamma-adaptin, 107 KD [Ramularia collo-cygni]